MSYALPEEPSPTTNHRSSRGKWYNNIPEYLTEQHIQQLKQHPLPVSPFKAIFNNAINRSLRSDLVAPAWHVDVERINGRFRHRFKVVLKKIGWQRIGSRGYQAFNHLYLPSSHTDAPHNTPHLQSTEIIEVLMPISNGFVYPENNLVPIQYAITRETIEFIVQTPCTSISQNRAEAEALADSTEHNGIIYRSEAPLKPIFPDFL